MLFACIVAHWDHNLESIFLLICDPIHISCLCCRPHNLGTGAPCSRDKTFECLPKMVCMFPKGDYPLWCRKGAGFCIPNAPQSKCIMCIWLYLVQVNCIWMICSRFESMACGFMQKLGQLSTKLSTKTVWVIICSTICFLFLLIYISNLRQLLFSQ